MFWSWRIMAKNLRQVMFLKSINSLSGFCCPVQRQINTHLLNILFDVSSSTHSPTLESSCLELKWMTDNLCCCCSWAREIIREFRKLNLTRNREIMIDNLICTPKFNSVGCCCRKRPLRKRLVFSTRTEQQHQYYQGSTSGIESGVGIENTRTIEIPGYFRVVNFLPKILFYL